MSDGVSARPHCTLTVVVGDEHGLLKHIHVPNVVIILRKSLRVFSDLEIVMCPYILSYNY